MPSLVIVGHLVLDHIHVKKAAYRPTVGGSPTYAGLAAVSLGCQVKVISKVGEDFPDEYVVWLSSKGIDLSGLKRVKGARSTSFVLTYRNDERDLRLKGRCEPIEPGDVPAGLQADGVHLGPVAQEVPAETLMLLSALSPCLSLDPQGYVRRFDANGIVCGTRGPELGLLKLVRVLKASRREMALLTGFEDPFKACQFLKANGTEVVIATAGAGETLVLGGGEDAFTVPLWPSKVIDPTGAGDAFIGAFLAEYLRGCELAWCACVGAASASFVVEGYGPSAFGSREEVYERAERLLKDVKRRT